MRKLPVAGAVGALALIAGGAYFVAGSAGREAHRNWQLIERYCVDCHNKDDYTANIAFDELSPDSIANEAALWEAAVRKLRGRMMPPPGGPVPSDDEYASFISWMETSLDEAAADHPYPGRIQLHRLNRTEYANAIEDLFGLEVDAEALLPKDDESDGFDNVANVLKVSPSFLDQYLSAARTVSAMAIGDPAAKIDSQVYYVPAGTNQNFHVEGLPLGTRGGLLVEHFFPVDGLYEIDIGGLARARYVEGLEYRHRLIITVDGVRVYENELGGEEDMKAVDQRQAAAVAEINARFENVPIRVTAGPHDIGVTFVARTLSESDSVLQPFIPGGGEVGIIEGEERVPRVERVEIVGPLEATGLTDTPSRKRILVCRPESAADALPCAERILANVARRAFRRPVSAADLEAPLDFYARGLERGGFEAGIRDALTMILASPEFLYRLSAAPEDLAPGSIYAVSDLELASRLAFFLWSRLPDEELLALAADGRLSEPDVLKAQVERMLASPHARSLVTNFAFQWLDVRGVIDIVPDPTLFPEYDSDLGQDFAKELELFVSSVLLEDRSVLDLLRADYTFVNERLALHYGIPSVRGDRFRRIRLEDENRWGLLGKGGILTATSYPNRTAPVLRGAWILEAITGTPPAPPPPGVEAFPETEEGGEVLTVRERLEAHRESPACNGCHGIMDPLGFALENFDAIGQWRTVDRDAQSRIDASGQLADGRVVDGPIELREALLERPEQFVQTLTEKLMIFALGRSVEHYDMPAIRRIVHDAAREDYRFSSLLAGIVTSEPFRYSMLPESDEGAGAEDGAVTARADTD